MLSACGAGGCKAGVPLGACVVLGSPLRAAWTTRWPEGPERRQEQASSSEHGGHGQLGQLGSGWREPAPPSQQTHRGSPQTAASSQLENVTHLDSRSKPHSRPTGTLPITDLVPPGDWVTRDGVTLTCSGSGRLQQGGDSRVGATRGLDTPVERPL